MLGQAQVRAGAACFQNAALAAGLRACTHSLRQTAHASEFNGPTRHPARSPYDLNQTRESGVAGKALLVPRINLLHDDGDLEKAVGVKEYRVAHGAPAPGRVAIDQ